MCVQELLLCQSCSGSCHSGVHPLCCVFQLHIGQLLWCMEPVGVCGGNDSLSFLLLLSVRGFSAFFLIMCA